jgi:23S rRNA pseudouridine1911/1915/1917 synthase
VARTQSAHEYLKKLFQACPERGQRDGGVKKTYLALVVGSVKKDSDIINAPIARSTKHFEKRVVGGKQGRSREAITHYKVIERFYGSSASMEAELPKGGYTLLEVSPKTGRTHQIRSHLAHIGHPIACDKLYGGRRYACPELVEGQPLARQFLHAASIEFISPSGAKMHFDVPLPEDLAQALKLLRSVK